ncbi:MAG: AmmeMemoRadiSam system radical SAM enzyme [Patescibacteria group bacterium]
MREAVLYKKLDTKGVQCVACAWRCTIAEGKRGVCGVRQNVGGSLQLLVYSYPVSVNLDPVEKKPLYHFLPGTQIFSLGTVGCNFACDFCQNFDISQVSKTGWDVAEVEQGPRYTPETIVQYCVDHHIPSIAFTYNEPTIFSEYAVDVMKLAKPHGMRGVYVSNGYETKETLDYLNDYIDAFNIDLKSFREEFYQKICHARLAPVLETIQELHQRGIWQELTTLLIPGKNDSVEEIGEIASFIAGISSDIPWHISAFHPEYKMTDVEVTPSQKLFEAYEIGKKAGLRYIYTGNIADRRHGNTLCPQCGSLMIERDGMYHTKVIAEKGVCLQCQTIIPGIWV